MRSDKKSLSHPAIFSTLFLMPLFLISCVGDDSADEDEVSCTTEALPAVEVVVRDAISLAPLADDADGILRDGDFVEVMQITERVKNADTGEFEGAILAGGFERAGTYSVSIEVDGYQDWERVGVAVSRSTCHVDTVRLTANMEAL